MNIEKIFNQEPVFNKDMLSTIESFLETFNDSVVGNVNYPPTNLYKIADKDQWILELVVAGFNKEDIKIELINGIVENSVLSVSADKIKEDEENKEYTLRKISKKGFKVNVPFNKTIDTVDATLKKGILKIILNFKQPENNKKLIEIK
jgi:HSP20 family molecular chaperone IbpA